MNEVLDWLGRTVQELSPVIVAGLGGYVTWLVAKQNRKATTEHQMIDQLQEDNKDLREEAREARAESTETRQQNKEVREENRVLRGQNEELRNQNMTLHRNNGSLQKYSYRLRKHITDKLGPPPPEWPEDVRPNKTEPVDILEPPTWIEEPKADG